MSAKLVIIYGLPGSGKSTLAKNVARAIKGHVVNMDDIRTELYGESYHTRMGSMTSVQRNSAEKKVASTKLARINALLREGEKVISDDTNLNPRNVDPMIALARKHDATILTTGVDVDVDTAKSRNRSRGAAGGRLVPEWVIDNMAKKAYHANGTMKKMVVLDDSVCYR